MSEKLMRLLPNTLSIMRFLFGGVFAFMLVFRLDGVTIPWWWLLSCFAVIAFTDLLDGRIARNFHCQSNAGAILDVTADSFYILLSLVIMNVYNIIPIWFTITVILKLGDFILSSWIFSMGKNVHFIFDFLGRFTVVGYYFVPILGGIFPHTSMLNVITLFLMIMSVGSSIFRWGSFALQRT